MPANSHPALPEKQTAIIQDAKGASKLAHGVPLPVLKAGTVMVKVVAVARK